MNKENGVERRLRRRYRRKKYGTHTMTLSCPLCGASADITEYKSPESKSSPADYSLDIDVACDHLEEIEDIFQRVRRKEIQRARERMEEEMEALKHGDYCEPHPADVNRCPYCGDTHGSLYGLINHIERGHKKELNVCPYCDKSLKNLRGLKYHIARVHENKPYDTRDLVLRNIAQAWGLDHELLSD